MDDKIIISRIKFNEHIAVITITESSYDKKRIAAKIMRKIADQERKQNRPVMYVEMNRNDAQTLFSNTKSLEIVNA